MTPTNSTQIINTRNQGSSLASSSREPIGLVLQPIGDEKMEGTENESEQQVETEEPKDKLKVKFTVTQIRNINTGISGTINSAGLRVDFPMYDLNIGLDAEVPCGPSKGPGVGTEDIRKQQEIHYGGGVYENLYRDFIRQDKPEIENANEAWLRFLKTGEMPQQSS
ncbi:hypothetical protein H0H87_009476 [Tephrocybe sp. NHM501043]|nr:hypothetical protein H0H87_009476 [Tephrocybe sp. NHM501043]